MTDLRDLQTSYQRHKITATQREKFWDFDVTGHYVTGWFSTPKLPGITYEVALQWVREIIAAEILNRLPNAA